MYESLIKHYPTAHLYVLAFDNKCYDILNKINLKDASIISLKQFETNELLKVKKTRKKNEYCWTCTPSLILYCLEHFNLDTCTYLDADIYFFSSPEPLFKELPQGKSVMITEHRFSSQYKELEKTSGKYCVQFMTFKKNDTGTKVLKWWKDACLEWCYAYYENGKFGDQKYLDDWTNRFKGIHELQHLGGGVAPWNVQQYDFSKEFNLIFYHFHGLRFIPKNKILLGPYSLSNKIISLIYQPYVKHLEKIKNQIYQLDKSIDPHGIDNTYNKKIRPEKPVEFIKNMIKSVLRKNKKPNNYIFSTKKFIQS